MNRNHTHSRLLDTFIGQQDVDPPIFVLSSEVRDYNNALHYCMLYV